MSERQVSLLGRDKTSTLPLPPTDGGFGGVAFFGPAALAMAPGGFDPGALYPGGLMVFFLRPFQRHRWARYLNRGKAAADAGAEHAPDLSFNAAATEVTMRYKVVAAAKHMQGMWCRSGPHFCSFGSSVSSSSSSASYLGARGVSTGAILQTRVSSPSSAIG